MGLVLIIAAALWGICAVLKIPYALRGLMIGLLWLAVILVHLLLPYGNALRQATGGSAAPWLLLGGLALLILIYREARKWARSRAQPEQQAKPNPARSLSETELNRYPRHTVMREIGGPGQKKLKKARDLVIGAGGVGSPALLYLAGGGGGPRRPGAPPQRPGQAALPPAGEAIAFALRASRAAKRRKDQD